MLLRNEEQKLHQKTTIDGSTICYMLRVKFVSFTSFLPALVQAAQTSWPLDSRARATRWNVYFVYHSPWEKLKPSKKAYKPVQ